MRRISSEGFDRFNHWLSVAGLLTTGAVAWALLSPANAFWTAVLAAALGAASLATVLVVRDRAVPSLAQVIDAAERER